MRLYSHLPLKPLMDSIEDCFDYLYIMYHCLYLKRYQKMVFDRILRVQNLNRLVLQRIYLRLIMQ